MGGRNFAVRRAACSGRRVWKSLAKKLDIFRRQFADDWLMELRKRHIDDHVQDPIAPADVGEGDLMLIRKENVKKIKCTEA